jgi:hypothetical protein
VSHVTLTPATAADFAELAARSPNTPPLPKVQTIAIAGKVDGRVIAIGGVCFLPNGQRQAFADVTDEAREHPIALHKAALATIALARKHKIWRLTATTSSGLDRDLRWLLRLGFRPEDGTTNFVLDL